MRGFLSRLWIRSCFAFAALSLLSVTSSYASSTLDVELDPIDFALGGYRAHVGYIHAPLRYDLGVLNVVIPGAVHGNKRFEYEIFGFIARLDYLFGAYEGWFAGAEATWMKNTYTHRPSHVSEEREPVLLALRSGYRFEFFHHLTVTPWVGFGALLNKGGDVVRIQSDTFEVSTWNIFPTVHVGWAF